jgi:hypothetical protein
MLPDVHEQPARSAAGDRAGSRCAPRCEEASIYGAGVAGVGWIVASTYDEMVPPRMT